MSCKMLKEISKILTQIPEENLEKFAQLLLDSKTHRIWLIGNGGSSSSASHFASDLSAIGFDTICLTDNVSRLTAITNDYSWEDVFINQLEHMRVEDILIAISVHGGSDSWSCNLTKAAAFANGRGAKILSLTGFDGGKLAQFGDFGIIVPSERTYIIEGIHGVLFHVICKKIEEKEQK